jgi:hypothetical protein
MKFRSLIPLFVATALIATAEVSQQSSGEDVTLVIENTLKGIGRAISASSASGDVQIRYDAGGAMYHVTSADGATVEIDARTGQHTIRATRPGAVDVTVENGLDAVGSILRSVSAAQTGATRGVEVALSSTERKALETIWRAQGLTQEQVDAYAEILRNAKELESYARELERSAKELERSIEADARQLEDEARQIEREAKRIEKEAERVSKAYQPAGVDEAVFSCGGGDELELMGRTIDSDGVVVYAFGSCDVVIENCEITSRSVAIRVEGNADVEIVNSRIEGAIAAIQHGGNADIEASGTDFIGEIVGNGDFEDNGGNTFRSK